MSTSASENCLGAWTRPKQRVSMSRFNPMLSPDSPVRSNKETESTGMSSCTISESPGRTGAWVVISFIRKPPGLSESFPRSLNPDGWLTKDEAVFGGVGRGAVVYVRLEFCSNTENWVSLGLNGAFVSSGRLSCKYLQALMFDLTQGRHGRSRSHLYTCHYR